MATERKSPGGGQKVVLSSLLSGRVTSRTGKLPFSGCLSVMHRNPEITVSPAGLYKIIYKNIYPIDFLQYTNYGTRVPVFDSHDTIF